MVHDVIIVFIVINKISSLRPDHYHMQSRQSCSPPAVSPAMMMKKMIVIDVDDDHDDVYDDDDNLGSL